MTGWPSEGERPVVGFIGLGRMGAPMALNVRAAGFDVVVFDARAEAVEPLVEAGAIAAESVPNTAAQCDILITMLPGPAQVETVMAGRGGAFQALRHGAVWVDMTTSTPAFGRALALEGEPRGVAVVDAPVEGAIQDAVDGSLQVIAGGAPEDIARIRPILEAMGDAIRVLHVGPRGAGYAVKLCLNLRRFIDAAASAELRRLGVAASLDVESLERALLERPAIGATTQPLGAAEADGDDLGFLLDEPTQELGQAVDLGRELGVPLELAALVEQLHRRAQARRPTGPPRSRRVDAGNDADDD